jgi:hypothetical protein
MSSSMDESAFGPGLASGARVEVRNHFDGGWSGGFVIEAPLVEGYSLRRLSDRSVLPRVFTPGDIRLDLRQGR